MTIIFRHPRRLVFITIFAVASLLSTAKSRAASIYIWTNSTVAGGNYSAATNWFPNIVPADQNSFAWLTNGGTVLFNDGLTNGQLYIAPVNGSTGTFKMNGGNLWVSTNNLYIGGIAQNTGIGSSGSLVMTDGTLVAEKNGVRDVMILGQASGSTGIFTMSNGTAIFYGGVEIAFYGYGVLNVNGGTLIAHSWFQPGRGQGTASGSGIFNMTAGTVFVLRNANNENNNTRGLYLAQAGTNGVVNISGGTLYSSRIAFSGSGVAQNEQLNVSGGDLYIGPDGISGSKAGVTSVNVSGGTFHTVDMVASIPAFPGDLSSVLDDGCNWTWSGQAVNLTNTINGMGGVGFVTFAPETNRTITLNNQWIGNGSLIINGPGAVSIGTIDTYTGNTTVLEGTLAFSGNGAISNASAITLANGTTIDASALASPLILAPQQTLTNSGTNAILAGNINTGSSILSLLYAGTPSFSISNGTLTLTPSTTFNINNTGAPLAGGNYKLISALQNGAASGAGLPSATVSGNGVASGELVSLSVQNNELYLVVTNDHPPVIANDIRDTPSPGASWQIAITNLAAQAGWSDPDGDAVSFQSVDSSSANDVTITTDGTNIYYAGPFNSDDSFTYSITDGKLTASGTIYLDLLTTNSTALIPSDANYVTSLNGTWRFYLERMSSYYTGSPPNVFLTESSEAFQNTNYVETASWTNVTVPSNWEMLGFSPCTYYTADNTSGLYRYWLNVPDNWRGRRVYLNLDGVQDGAEVWLNGKKVSVDEPTWGISNYHEGGWSAFNVDLTPQVNFGTSNLVAIRVVKKAASLDLDTGDYFLLGGIFRPVTCYSVPYTNFAGVQITTHLLPNNQAEVDVSADVNNGDGSTAVLLTLNNVATVTNAANGKAVFSQIIDQPKLWSAEFPNLYNYSLQLQNNFGQVIETINNRLGIRELTFSNAVLLLNGVPVKLAGVCNHDSWAAFGNAIGSNQWRQDILMMKAANINAIRTTHYTFGSGFFDLCDELGMYVADELPMCWCNNETPDLNYRGAFEQRTRETLRRDRNHPSVVIWAIGNENSAGTNLQATADLIKSMDTTRPRLVSTFAPSAYNVELGDRHYPTTNQMVSDAVGARSTGHPYVYLEQPNTWDVRLAADASMWERWGMAQQRVWNVCMQYETIIGTFPFEWSDRAVADPNPDSSYVSTRVQQLYSFPSGIHLLKCKGMVDGFRNPRPSVYEAKMIYSPIQFTNVLTISGNQLSFPITNRYSFTDLSNLTMTWQLQRSSITLASGTAPISLAPLTNGIAQITVPNDALTAADSLQVDFIHPNGNDVVTGRFIINHNPTTALDANLPANLPIPQINLVVRQTVSDPGLWQKVNRYPSSLANVTINPAGATNLSQVQSISATIVGGGGSSTLGTVTAQFTNNQFSYTINWTGANWTVQELGWMFQMPNTYTNFSWDRASRWSYYAGTSIARPSGTANPASMNADITGMYAPNSFDFNSTKYDCNWAGLTSSQGDGLRVEFNSSQRFHCRGGTNSQGTVLYVNQQVSLPDDFTSPIVPDQIMTIKSGNVISGSFTVGSMATIVSNATVSLSNLIQNYDGTAKTVFLTTTPPSLSTWITYNGSTTAPTNPGSYTVVATVTDAHYRGAVTNTMTILLGGLRLISSTPNSDGSMAFTWNAIAGNTYALRYKDTLTDPQWLTLTTGLAPTGSRITISDPATNSQRFYRIDSPAGSSDIAGYIRLPLLGNSDNFVAAPFIRPGATYAQVSSVSGNVITATGFPDWANNQFVYSGAQTNHYYVRLISGAARGRIWPVTANTGNTLTVDNSNDDLSSLAPTDILAIEPNWSLATAFIDSSAINVSPTIGTRNTELLVPDLTGSGINLSASKIYFYNAGLWKIVGQGNVDHSQDIIAPNTHFIVRHNVATNTTWTAFGIVDSLPITLPLRTQSALGQDNFIGLARPAVMTLNQSGLISSGAFAPSPLPGSRTDELLTFDNTVAAKNKSASAVYYYWSNAWRSVGTGILDVGNNPVFQPGVGFILRKGTNSPASTWTNNPNW